MIGKAEFNAIESPAQLEAMAEAFMSAPLTSAMQECAGIGRQAMRDNFTSSISPDGISWVPRKRAGDGHPLLMDKGPLIQAATGGGSGHIEQVGDRDFAMGVDGAVIPYAATHNFGRTTGRGAPIPQREYAGLQDKHQDQCAEVIANGMLEVLG